MDSAKNRGLQRSPTPFPLAPPTIRFLPFRKVLQTFKVTCGLQPTLRASWPVVLIDFHGTHPATILPDLLLQTCMMDLMIARRAAIHCSVAFTAPKTEILAPKINRSLQPHWFKRENAWKCWLIWRKPKPLYVLQSRPPSPPSLSPT